MDVIKKSNSNPIIVAIGYNRPDNLRRLLNALEDAYYPFENVTLYISVDYGGSDLVKRVATDATWSHGDKVLNFEINNLGLKRHIFKCADLSIEYGAAILFEDDIVPSKYFYSYVLQCLKKYENNNNIFAISLYTHSWNGLANMPFTPNYNGFDAYFIQVPVSWGECIIGNRWLEFRDWLKDNEDINKLDIKIPKSVFSWGNSQGKYIYAYIAQNNKYYVSPYISHSTNFHSSGVHTKHGVPTFQSPLSLGDKEYNLPEYDEAVKYDSFFESIDLKAYVEEKYNKRVCINFYGLKSDYSGYDYVLSTSLLPNTVVDGYSLQMRPYEMNIYYNIKEDSDIFLYDLNKSKPIKKNRPQHYRKLLYQVRYLSIVDCFFFLIALVCKRFWEK